MFKMLYVEAASYLQINLPFNKKVNEYAQLLHPQKKMIKWLLIFNLALKVLNVFRSRYSHVFTVSSEKSSDIVDMIRNKWQMYQVQNIPESMYLLPETSKSRTPVNDAYYWDYALKCCGVFPESSDNETKHVRIDEYWNSVGNIRNETGVLKYP